MTRMRNSRAAQRGFTLLEVLVAMMILGLSLGAILHQFALASRAGSASHDTTRATMYAREKLEDLKLQPELVEATERGSFDDGYEWETTVQYYNYDHIEDQMVLDNMRYETYLLTVVVFWQIGQSSFVAEFTPCTEIKLTETKKNIAPIRTDFRKGFMIKPPYMRLAM